ncbi:hypothetical protein QJQ45_013006 [Haematococcus lacustris]|nr:hypothetical protein QJQ45_013006 [Haematococcus lacustris]
MDAEMVPIHTDGADERFTDLRIAFRKRFGDDPEVFARAPGEHIDYEGYGVLPMAIKQDTVVAIRKGGSQLVVSNLVDDAYPAKTYAADPAQGVYELLHEVQHQPVPEPSGLQVMIHGQVPLGGGLSSSAAFVCACMVGILGVHDISLPKAQVAEFAARAERYIGVTGGGMDQAISMMGMHGVAKLIDFNPVRAADVVLPAGAVFVIGNSLAVSNKAVGAHKRYNLRVVECRLAAAMLARALGKPQEWCRSVVTLRELEPVVEQASGKSGLAACAEAVQQHLTQDLYSHSEVEAALGISLDELYASSREARKAAQGAQEDGGFKLRQRALHVYQEAQRVRDFKAVCDGTQAPEAKMATLGALMDSSHASCAGLYECSCPELEELVATAKAAGALGARLTGAGWGGCTVSLVKESDVDAFMAAVRERYYASRIASGVVSEADMDKMFFASKPSSGAAVLKLGSRAYNVQSDEPELLSLSPLVSRILDMADKKLVPITREVLRNFYAQYPLEPVPVEYVTLLLERINEACTLVSKPGSTLRNAVWMETPKRIDDNLWRTRQFCEEIIDSLRLACKQLTDHENVDFRGALIEMRRTTQENRNKKMLDDLLRKGGTTRQKYELFLQQQWERREALVQMGNLSGMFKFMVKYLGGVPQVLLDFAQDINAKLGPMEEQRLKYGPDVYQVLPLICEACTFYSEQLMRVIGFLGDIFVHSPFFITQEAATKAAEQGQAGPPDSSPADTTPATIQQTDIGHDSYTATRSSTERPSQGRTSFVLPSGHSGSSLGAGTATGPPSAKQHPPHPCKAPGPGETAAEEEHSHLGCGGPLLAAVGQALSHHSKGMGSLHTVSAERVSRTGSSSTTQCAHHGAKPASPVSSVLAKLGLGAHTHTSASHSPAHASALSPQPVAQPGVAATGAATAANGTEAKQLTVAGDAVPVLATVTSSREGKLPGEVLPPSTPCAPQAPCPGDAPGKPPSPAGSTAPAHGFAHTKALALPCSAFAAASQPAAQGGPLAIDSQAAHTLRAGQAVSLHTSSGEVETVVAVGMAVSQSLPGAVTVTQAGSARAGSLRTLSTLSQVSIAHTDYLSCVDNTSWVSSTHYQASLVDGDLEGEPWGFPSSALPSPSPSCSGNHSGRFPTPRPSAAGPLAAPTAALSAPRAYPPVAPSARTTPGGLPTILSNGGLAALGQAAEAAQPPPSPPRLSNGTATADSLRLFASLPAGVITTAMQTALNPTGPAPSARGSIGEIEQPGAGTSPGASTGLWPPAQLLQASASNPDLPGPLPRESPRSTATRALALSALPGTSECSFPAAAHSNSSVDPSSVSGAATTTTTSVLTVGPTGPAGERSMGSAWGPGAGPLSDAATGGSTHRWEGSVGLRSVVEEDLASQGQAALAARSMVAMEGSDCGTRVGAASQANQPAKQAASQGNSGRAGLLIATATQDAR